MRRAIIATLLLATLSIAVACGDESAPASGSTPAEGDASSSSSSSSSSSGDFGEAGVECRSPALPASKASRETIPSKASLRDTGLFFGTYAAHSLRLYAPDAGAVYEPDVWRGVMVIDGFGGIAFATEDASGVVTSQTYRINGDPNRNGDLGLVCESAGAGAPKMLPQLKSVATLDPDASAFVTELTLQYPGEEPYLRVYRRAE